MVDYEKCGKTFRKPFVGQQLSSIYIMIVSVPMMFYCYHAAVDGIANRLEKSVVVLWQLEVNAVHNKTTPPTIPSNSSTVSVPSYLKCTLGSCRCRYRYDEPISTPVSMELARALPQKAGL